MDITLDLVFTHHAEICLTALPAFSEEVQDGQSAGDGPPRVCPEFSGPTKRTRCIRDELGEAQLLRPGVDFACML